MCPPMVTTKHKLLSPHPPLRLGVHEEAWVLEKIVASQISKQNTNQDCPDAQSGTQTQSPIPASSSATPCTPANTVMVGNDV